MKDIKFEQFCSRQQIDLISIVSDQYHDAPRSSIGFSARLSSVMTEVDQQLIRLTEKDRIEREGKGYFRI